MEKIAFFTVLLVLRKISEKTIYLSGKMEYNPSVNIYIKL